MQTHETYLAQREAKSVGPFLLIDVGRGRDWDVALLRRSDIAPLRLKQ